MSAIAMDILVTNRPKCFQKTSTVVIGLHKMIISCLKTTFKKISLKKNTFRDYKKFAEQNFLYDLDQQMIKGTFYKEKNGYENFSDTFKQAWTNCAPDADRARKTSEARIFCLVKKKKTMKIWKS